MAGDSSVVTVLLGGDVMLGRGVDQILRRPGDPRLREPYLRDARGYIRLAEHANGPIPRPVDWNWPWGEVLPVLDEAAPDVRLINLETTITAGGQFAARKTVCYRMHPDNLPALTALRPDVCALANNHILDFGYQGLTDTVVALTGARIQAVGAGADLVAARRPAVLEAHGGHRVLVVSLATLSSGVPETWAAQPDRPGVWLIADPSLRDAADEVATAVLAQRRDGDVAIASVHWGSNWGYAMAPSEIEFAHRLVDAGVDVVHGHSSHHPRPIEIYRGRPVLYGCGDVIDDYEGIRGHEPFRGDLRLLYLVDTDAVSGELVSLRMIPLRLRRMRLERASRDDTEWLRTTMGQISRCFGTRVAAGPDGFLDVVTSRGDRQPPITGRAPAGEFDRG